MSTAEAIRLSLYSGSIKIFRKLPSALELCSYFENDILSKNISGMDLSAESISSQSSFLCTTLSDETIISMSSQFEDLQAKSNILWKNIIKESKLHAKEANSHPEDDADILWDRVRLRVQRSGDELDDISNSKYSKGRFSSTLALHRDTWANNVQQQLNWWMPLVPITEGRTVALYPSFFSSPIANNSADWSIQKLRKNRELNISYPQLPTVSLDDLSEEDKKKLNDDMTPIVIEPGDVLVFSGEHLHGSVLNKTGLTRFSSEVRTVDAGDLYAKIGAVNVDGKCPDYNISWFRHLNK